MNDLEFKALLQGEYRDVFAQAKSFGMISDLDDDYLKESLTDLGDLLLTAQEKGTPAEKIVGKDIEVFCRSYFSEFTPKDRAAKICKTIFGDLWFVLISNILLLAGESGSDLFAIHTNQFSGWILIFDCIYILFYNIVFSTAMRRVYFRIRHREWVQTLGTVAIVGLAMLICAYFSDLIRTVPACLMVLLSGGYILCYLLVLCGSRYRRTGHLYDPEKRQSRREKRAQKRLQRERAFVTAMAQRYHRQNETRTAKGKAELSSDAYMETFQKENRRANLYLLLLVLAALWCFAMQYLTCSWWLPQFAWPTFAFDGIVLFIIWYLFLSPFVYRMRRTVEEKCRENGMDILTYADWLSAKGDAAEWQS